MTSNSQGTPILYKRLVQDIKIYIEKHALSPGDRLPSMSELCTLFGVSHMTVRAALKTLTDEGVLESRQRQGIFVSKPKDNKAANGNEKMIGVLVPRGDHPFEGGIIRGVMEQCQVAGYQVVIANSNDQAEQESHQLKELAARVNGLIVFPAFEGASYSAYAELLERGIPWVFVDRSLAGLSAPLVSTDNEVGGYLATRHLLEQGCEQVYALTGHIVSSTQERLLGHRRALKEWGISDVQNYVRHSTLHTHVVGYHYTKEIISQWKQGERIGIFTLDENIARTCYAALKEAQLRIPEDISVVAYDDFAAKFFDPPLTAVRQEPYKMGVTAAKLLLDKVNHRKVASQEVRLKPELKVRSSSDEKMKFSWAEHQNELEESRQLLEQETNARSELSKPVLL